MNESAQHVLEAKAQGEDGLDVGWGTSAEGAGDFDGGAGFAAFCEGDGKHARLIPGAHPRGAFSRVERSRSSALPSLHPEVSIPDANVTNELHQLQRELIANEPMMRKGLVVVVVGR